ncbi:hypothetical protein JQC72_12770 [Polycladomyces sp. WAk]|uniref:Uncharacterized protein n=1 Tax=Polycladomyces zharkentensis TaxID=2807616 RepID=A0ABS2WLQ6_9BACL|nr:hypothetical protein [Polycladomyces sp. WAk]MBN2910371.1 hypothetical protein [Polycladomyces sp. WAk]
METEKLISAKDVVVQFVLRYKKWLLIAVAVVAVLVGVISAMQEDPNELINQFEKAVATGDVDELEDLVDSDDVDLDEKYLRQFINHAQNHADYMQATMQILRWQLAIYDPTADTGMEYGTDAFPSIAELKNMGDFYLRKNEHWLLPDTYDIVVRPYYLNLKTNEPDAVLKVDGKEVLKTTNDKLTYRMGPLMPGVYEISAEKKFPYANLHSKQKMELFGYDDHNVTGDLTLERFEVGIESTFPDTQVWINGKSTGKTVAQMSKFGPVSKDGSVKISGRYQFPWGPAQSEAIAVDENTESVDITPNPFLQKQYQKMLTDVINQFAKQKILAQLKRDISVMTTATDNVKENYLVPDYYDGTYKGEALGTTIDYDQVSLSEEDGVYTVTLPVKFHYKLKLYDQFTDPNEPLDEEFEDKQVTLEYHPDTKKWVVSNEESLYDFGSGDYFTGAHTVQSDFK